MLRFGVVLGVYIYIYNIIYVYISGVRCLGAWGLGLRVLGIRLLGFGCWGPLGFRVWGFRV